MPRKLPAATLPTQAFLLMACSIAIVSGALIWHQGDIVKQEVLGERLAAITRQVDVLEGHATDRGIGHLRAALGRYLQREMEDVTRRLGVSEAVVTDETGRIVAAADVARVGQIEPDEQVRLILSGAAESVMRPGKGEENEDFAFTIALNFPAFRGSLHVTEDIQELNQAIADSTWRGALPAVLMLLFAAPLAALVARRILMRTQQSEQERAWQGRFQSLVQSASDVILVVGTNGAIQYATPATQRVLGRSVADVQGTSVLDLIHPADIGAAQSVLATAEAAPGRVGHAEYRVRHEDGRWLFAEVHAANLHQDPAVRGTVLTIRDVSERKALEAQLSYQALHDPLTGLANRALFSDRLGHALTRARRGDSSLAVLLVDLDDFKLVNDTHGHQAGDAVLAQVGQRMLACIREGDTAARLGGDEFAILLEDVTPQDVVPISGRILASFDEPVTIEGGALTIHASVGVAHGDRRVIDTADFLTRADVAMYAAKDGGGGRLTIFEPGMRMAASQQVEATAELRRAIDEGQLEVHYQPIVEVASGAIRGMEALVRWRHPIRGELPPSEFIRLAEVSGLIVPLGEVVLDRACRQARSWQLQNPDGEPLTISVNLSAAQLDDGGLIAAVRTALRASGLPPTSLILEITESVLVHDAEATTSRLRELKELGVRLAIDDFGTGYSSLSYLRRFPIDIIKIDKSFVDGLDGSGPVDALAKSIVRLAHSLQLTTVAEGVEQPRQLARLVAMGCDEAQGYLFARPLDVAGATEYLRQATRSLSTAG